MVSKVRLNPKQATQPVIAANGSRLLLLMIDGLALRPFEDALAAGELPNIQALMARRPTSFMQAISTFPSATSPSIQELLSGRYAGIDTQEPGAVHAFDREERRIIRYATEPHAWQWPQVTLFDATRGMPAITVFEGEWDGPQAVLTQFNLVEQAIFEILGAGSLSGGDRGPVEVFLKSMRSVRPPMVSLVVLNEFDMRAHFHGPESEPARQALVDSDRLIGEVIQTLDQIPGQAGHSLLDETNIMLFGDHGSVTSGQYVDLAGFLTLQGLEAVDVSTIPHVVLRERLGTLWTMWPDAILVSGGSNITQVYLRKPGGGWSENDTASPGETRRAEQSPDAATLAQSITRLEGVDQVLRMDDQGAIQVLGRKNSLARILVRNGDQGQGFAYIVPDKASIDPFGYLADADVANLVCRESESQQRCYYSREEWYQRTVASDYPGAPALIPKAFQPQRYTGDLMVTLLPGYSFLRNQKGDHGNLYRDAILTPLIINGPGVTACTESQQPKLVDIYPSAAVLLGADPADPALQGLDGRILDCVAEAVSQHARE